MRKVLTALALSLLTGAVVASTCSTSSVYIDGKVVVCTTCCYPGAGCNTTCF